MSQTTRAHRTCTRCVMDTTDPGITFDRAGVCSHCHAYDEGLKEVFTGDEGRRRLDNLVSRIKRDGAGKRYDCVIGVSGGVDSTYVAWLVKQLGLRPLAVHLDNGWDSELAVSNIHQALTRLQIDLHTHVIDWEEFKDLQLAFLRASTPDSEIPSDHAIFALLHRTAEREGVRYILSGMNRRTESHLPAAWSQGHWDWGYIRSVHRRYGHVPLRTFPRMPFFRLLRWRRKHAWIDILNYVDYVKADAIKLLEEQLGWRSYGAKHFESIYTRFYQGYILPKKFGFDKRKMHFSSLICAGEMTRAEALRQLEAEPYPVELQAEDRAYVIEKFGLTPAAFDELMRQPPRAFAEFPSYHRYYQSGLYRFARAWYRRFRREEAGA